MLWKIHWKIQCLAQSKQHTVESGIIHMNIIHAQLLSSIVFGCMDLIHKRQPINYYFVLVLRTPTNLVYMDRMHNKFCFGARLVVLISTKTKEYFFGHNL